MGGKVTGGGNGGAITGKYKLKRGRGTVPIGGVMIKGVT